MAGNVPYSFLLRSGIFCSVSGYRRNLGNGGNMDRIEDMKNIHFSEPFIVLALLLLFMVVFIALNTDLMIHENVSMENESFHP